MQVHVAAEDPVREAICAALDDVDVTTVESEPAALSDARFGIVAAVTGGPALETANEAALAGETPWLAVEVGGIGGHRLPDVDASITGFAPGNGCYDCLGARVDSLADETDDAGQTDRPTARFVGALAGREAIRIFTGEEPSILGHLLEVPHRRRRLLPVPGCDCGPSSPARTIERDDDSLPLEVAVECVEVVIDDRIGLIREIGEVESFPLPYYLATSADTAAYSDASAARQAAGVATDWNTALMKAVGEALERYCAGVYREEWFHEAAETDLERTVSPTDVCRPDDSPGYDPNEPIRWVPGENLATGEETYLPAAAVQFPQPGEAIVPSITTGLGLGSSTVDAVVSGLTEVIERDATMLAWYSTFDPLELTVADDRFETLVRRARSEQLEVTPLLVTQDIDVPVVAVAVHRDPDTLETPIEPDAAAWPAFAMGSAADLDATEAAIGALEEALQNWMELRSIGPGEAADASGAIGEYAAFPDPARELLETAGTVATDRVGPDSTPTGEAALEPLCDRLAEVDLTPFAARLTTRDVETLGFEAVRVVVPGAQPLFTREASFGARAETVPADLGFEPDLERPFHPYP